VDSGRAEPSDDGDDEGIVREVVREVERRLAQPSAKKGRTP
jgi:hypothetical protein